MNTTLRKARKSTQRERLLGGITHIAARDGYGAATIAQVITHAGVSRPTFYDYFTDKDDCFLAALADIQERLLTDIRQAVHGQAPEHATQVAIGTLIGFANSQPTMAHVLLNEAMAGGPLALDARDHGIAEIEKIIEQAREQLSSDTATPDLSGRILIGGIYRLLASRLRRGEPSTIELLEDLLGWIKSYEQPLGEHRWCTLRPVRPLGPSPFVPEIPLHAPSALAPGRPRLSKAEVAENHRQRILFAVSRLAEDKGYTAITIADITKLAGVDARAFYRLFADKQEAFGALHELHFRHLMAVTAGAFSGGATWPARIWEAGRAFAQYMEQNPTLAHASFIESHAGGPVTRQRVEELVSAFTIFLHEGYQYTPLSAPPSRLALEAIAMTVFELDYYQVRDGRTRQLSGLLPHVAFISLAPFMGAAEANRFIDGNLNTSHEHPTEDVSLAVDLVAASR